MPAAGTSDAGPRRHDQVNASVDPAQGGDPTLLRDGGISGNPAYVYNATGGSGLISTG